MSFLNTLRAELSKEEFEDQVVEPVSEGEAQAIEQEYENRVNEIESLDSQRERAERVVDELETQQEAVRAIVEQNGGLTENEAALIESQRRTAAVALDIDPDSETGKEIVDEPGLEAMVNHGVLSLEENEKFTDKVKRVIENIIKTIKEKIESFVKWFGKFTNILTNKAREAYGYLKGLSDEEFKKRVDALPEEALKDAGMLFENGTYDFGKTVDAISAFASKAQGIIVPANAKLVKLAEKVSKNGGNASEEEKAEAANIMQQTRKELNDAFGRSANGNGAVEVLNLRLKYEAAENSFGRCSIEKLDKGDAKKSDLDKAKLLNAVNQGLFTKTIAKVRAESAQQDVKNYQAGKSDSAGAEVLDLIKLVSSYSTARFMLYTAATNGYNKLASIILALKAVSLESEEKTAEA